MKLIRKILNNPKIVEFIKFCVVGAICTTIDAGVFYAIHNVTGYRIAMICGFVLSVIVNYLLNIFWSFKSKPTLKNAIGVLAAHCINIFVVRMSLMWLFVDVMLIRDSIAYIPTLVISMITNFLIIKFVIKRFK